MEARVLAAAAEAVAEAADRLGAKRVFILAGATLNQKTYAVRQIAESLGSVTPAWHDEMPAHSPRDASIRCATGTRCRLRPAGECQAAGRRPTAARRHHLPGTRHSRAGRAGTLPHRGRRDDGQRPLPQYARRRVRQICVPTTLSGGEFTRGPGVTEPRLRLKQAYIHPASSPSR